VVELARKHGADLWVVECSLGEADTLRRLERRLQDGRSVSDGRWEEFGEQREDWEPITEIPVDRHIVLDTSGSVAETMRRLLSGSIVPTPRATQRLDQPDLSERGSQRFDAG
jgi:predicted kinase